MKTTFIYFLRDPTNPFKGYVGKTDSPATRLSPHLSDARKRKPTLKRGWIKNLVERGLKPVLEILDEVPFEHWPQLEVAYIEFFLEQGYDLKNSTPGGEDPPSWKGRKHSPEVCARIGTAHKGRKHSPESCAKMSASKTGTKRSPEACAAVSAGLIGRKVSAETRVKLKISNQGHVPWSKGKKFSPEYCAKLSASKTGEKHPAFGKKQSPETIAKRVATRKKKKILWQTSLLSLLRARSLQ